MNTINSPVTFENSHNIVGSFSAGSLTTNTPVNFDWNSNKYSSNSTCVGSACTAQNNRSLIAGGRKNNVSHINMSRRITFKKSRRRSGKSRRYKYTPAPNTRRMVQKYTQGGTRCKKKCRRRHTHKSRMRGGGCGCGAPTPIIAGGATNKMSGGKSVFDGSLPLSFGYGIDGGRLGANSSALASPIPFKSYYACSK